MGFLFPCQAALLTRADRNRGERAPPSSRKAFASIDRKKTGDPSLF